MKFTITAKDYNEIVKLGKLFAAGKTHYSEALQYIHVYLTPGPEWLELYAEASDGVVYGCVNAQLIEYDPDGYEQPDFLLPCAAKAFAGSNVKFEVNENNIVINEIQKTGSVLKSEYKNEFPGIYPDFGKILPNKETEAKAQIFSGKTFAKLAGFFGSDEQFNVWFRENVLYLGNENKICLSTAVKRGELENVLRR